MGPQLKALVEKLQVALVLPAEVPVALDLVAEHPMVAVLVVAALMVHQVIVVPEPMVPPTGDLAETQALAMEHPVVTQVIAVLEAIALPAEARVMTDHPAMETVGPPVVATAVDTAVVTVAVTVAATVVATAAVMAEAMVVVMAVVMVVAMAAVMAAETNRSYQKETPTFPLTCEELSANASAIRTLPESFMK